MLVAYLAVVFRALINSVNFIVIKTMDSDLPASHITILRAMISSAFIFIFFRNKLRFELRYLKIAVPLGILGVVMNQTFFAAGGRMTIPPHTSVIYSLIPIIIYSLSVLLGLEIFSLRKVSGIIIGFVGIFLIIYEKGIDMSSAHLKGDLIILAGAFTWSFFTLFSRNQKVFRDSVSLTMNTLFYGGIIYTLGGIYFLTCDFRQNILDPVNIFPIIYFALVTSVFSYLIWNFAIRRISPATASLVQTLQIIITTVITFFYTRYKPGTLFYLGSCTVITGLFLVVFPSAVRRNRSQKVGLHIPRL